MNTQLDELKTAIIFVAIVAVGTVAMLFMPMETSTVMMMVLPSMVVYGLIMLGLGVMHGRYRAENK